ncbi:polysaccharide deacetylase family protein [Candidatus Woesearchaeota archaeon]|jgi:peptidoglycan/xylan/chitin deacetylase (PgdA/CDA1 family)|nr:polysaccharide deacetylase family protein [Candidatus Woesearchaeota archaeon]MBT5397259.1 polysaccharide deacetylase family protein [Candidatus Woesearchaeota archaeon]MBT5924409.1 polysaccharide deacetylase family protein [Candidatus Woesearchaeota archaeon]MBT6367195.1 polysaccharide deacetylase family protein [Candidatus Woesearchaeota archaeon]MBT7762659.1 polysaccharide deacetylase family protein [Candidatus Woesearchaeota archaeon]
MIHITIDCEEWNSPYLRGKKDLDNFNTQFSYDGNTRLLELFSKHNVKATFFITGYYAERHPSDVLRIFNAGHEIACHGYEHHYRNRKFDVLQDIRKGKKIIETIIGEKIIGFRAPQVQYSLRLLEVLDSLGFEYDSSLHPAYLPGYYNNRSFSLRPHGFPHLQIKEIPVAVYPLTRLPIVWTFMRNVGMWWTQRAVNKLIRKKIDPVLYFHSWEFVKMSSDNVSFLFTRNTGKKFVSMLEKFIVVNKKKGRVFGSMKNGTETNS